MYSNINEQKITGLLLRLVEDDLTREEIEYLDKWFMANPNSIEYYWGFIKDYSVIKVHTEGLQFNDEFASNMPEALKILNKLSQIENNAPAIEIHNQLDDGNVVDEHKKVKGGRPKKIVRLYNVLISLAAVLMVIFIAYAHIFPPKYHVPVATFVNQVDVRWSTSSDEIKVNDRLLTNMEPYSISSGLINIAYDAGVDVVIEGPAEFKILREGIYMEYGTIYSRITEKGQGFVVSCRDTKYIDLGTEFGVNVTPVGSSELHVIDGEVEMCVSKKGEESHSRIVTQGYAASYNASSGIVREIEIRTDSFVRKIDSGSSMVWRGQTYIDLADIVGGGNGFGTGTIDAGVNAGTGGFVENYHTEHQYSRVNFVSVPGSKYIDGVFIPDGGDGPFVICSEGLEFSDCLDTDGGYWGCIQNGAIHAHEGRIAKHNLLLDGVEYCTKDNSAIFMHANQGITFDLDEVRSSIPGLKLKTFTSLCGLSDTIYDKDVFVDGGDPVSKSGDQPYSTFFVLVDGVIKAENEIDAMSGSVEIAIDIDENDRFLTLIACREDNVSFSWSMFARPVIQIKQK